MAEFLEVAAEELDAAASWYDERRSGLGDRFLDEVRDALQRLTERPYSGAIWHRASMPTGVRRIPLRSFPYLLVYVTEPRLVVVAVAHARRRPGYWRERMVEIPRPD